MKTKPAKISFSAKPPAAVTWSTQTFPAGTLVVGAAPGGAVCRVSIAPGGKIASVVKRWQKEWPETEFVKAKSAPKLAGAPLAMTGTPFQQKVWQGLLEIPAGETVSYGELARRIGKPKAARAVGSACGANPLLFIVPCHRVIAGDGSLGGFGSGLPLKKALLKAEKRRT